MAENEPFHLSKAPIIQAVLEILVEPEVKVDLKEIANLNNSFKEAFPSSRKRYKAELKITGGSEELHSQMQVDGYIFLSEDSLRTISAGSDRYDYSQANPYNTWEDFAEQARIYWDHYKRVARPKKIRRISVRYINKIDINLPIKDLKDYFTTFPAISEDLPQTLQNFYMRYEIPYNDTNNHALIALASGQTTDGIVSFLFDIDVMHLHELSSRDEEAIWTKFAELRKLKNDIFRSCLTESLIKNLE